ncbi:MAG: hypothetical protein CK424_03420 [Legionella sp.]|nr:MAG: hypothetical protein CK424_03420 [Legionella sp.]
MFSLINRPSNIDSPCTIPSSQLMIEGGYQHRTLVGDQGSAANLFPSIELRFGLPKATEFFTYLPSVIDSPLDVNQGVTGTTLGLKHEFFFTESFVATMLAELYPSSGSYYVGVQSPGTKVSLLIEKNVTSIVSVTGMLSFLYQGQSGSQQDVQYTALMPDVLISVALNPSVMLFTEVYGQTKVSPTLGSGFNVDGGLLFLVAENATIDVEASHRLSGYLGGFNAYVGIGGTIKL